ncbi:hypothetical protein DPMN_136760 [Dreissena polymorpha]|uniref:Uncharacterized protein n=1 Tax=Dreissena polymorpha TaxID=45954 RepID=A0A9D4G1G8_DREPO|nr:hypothetical protein DPMN_136760 [Dreissena polymorpha]
MLMEFVCGVCGWSMRMVYVGRALGLGMFVEQKGVVCRWRMRVEWGWSIWMTHDIRVCGWSMRMGYVYGV